MTDPVIPLDGGWRVREALGRTWQWYVDAPLPDAGNNVTDVAASAQRTPAWLPARVPGSVVGDLVRAGEVADPYVARQSRGVEWTATRHWVYRRRLDVPRQAESARAVLELDGVDPGGTVFVDGVEVGRVKGLYRPFRADVTRLLREPGPHQVAVVVEPVPPSEPQVGRTEDVRLHSPRLNYGWDFCPRLPHQGLWRPARLRTGRLLVHDVTVSTDTSGDLRHGTVQLDAWVDGSAQAGEPTIVSVVDGTDVVAEVTVSLQARSAAGTQRVVAAVQVDRPALWWPNGHGNQALYTVRIGHPDEPSVSWSGRTGFRTVRMLPNPGSPAGALPYTAEVNGVRIPLVGWNWAPVDALHGEVRRDRVRHLIGLAAASGARLVRVWGGGLVESHDFYDDCDEAGLLVWQEFSQSSSGFQSAPSSSEEYLQLMQEEAEILVPPRRRHPSLLMWGGGNELDVDGVPADESSSPVLRVLRDAVARLDPGRQWVPTSPTGPQFHNRLDVIEADPAGQHDVHGPWEHQGLVEHYRLSNAGTSLAHTEFGVEGMTNSRALDAVVPEKDQWPADRGNAVYRHLGDWWNNEPLVQRSFGHRLKGLSMLRRASQLLQATGLGYAVEADRRRSPRCSMVLPWQLNESFPNAWCTAAVDHLGEPKPSFHAATRAFRDERVTLRVDRAVWPDRTPCAQVWTWSVRGVAPGSSIRAKVLDADGKPLSEWSWHDLPAVEDPVLMGTAETTAPLAVEHDAVAFWEAIWTAADGSRIDRTVELMTTGDNWAGLMDLAPAAVETTVVRPAEHAATLEVAHRGGPALVGLQVSDCRRAGAPGRVRCAGDPRPLLPGERRRLGLAWDEGVTPLLEIQAWNFEPLVLDLDDRRT